MGKTLSRIGPMIRPTDASTTFAAREGIRCPPQFAVVDQPRAKLATVPGTGEPVGQLAARKPEIACIRSVLQRAEELTGDVPAAVESAVDSTSPESDTDIAEDFNLGGRGHRASPEEAGGPSAAGKVKNRMS